MANRRGKVEAVIDFILWARKWLWIVTAALTLKDTCSLKGKPWQTWTGYLKAEISLCQQRSIQSKLWFFHSPVWKWVVVQLLSYVQPFVTPYTVACKASLSFTISWSLLKLVSIELMLPSNDLILCHPLILLLSIFPVTRVFSQRISSSHQSTGLQFSISPSKLISLRINWLDLLSVQRILRSLLHHHNHTS